MIRLLFDRISLTLPLLACYQVVSFYTSPSPLWVSCFFIFISIFFIFRSFRLRIIDPIVFIAVLVFCIPFVHLFTLLFFNFNVHSDTIWGLTSTPYNLDLSIIKLTGLVCSVSSLSVSSIVSLVGLLPFLKFSNINKTLALTSLPLIPWLFICVFGLLLSFISAPFENILSSAYTVTSSISRDLNFSSAWLFSYTILTFLFVDAFLEPSLRMCRLKLIVILCSIFYVVIILQLLNGDRESLPWLFSLFVLYLTYFQEKVNRFFGMPVIKAKSVLTIAFLIFMSALLTSFMRSRIVNFDSIDSLIGAITDEYFSPLGFDNLIKGTWTSVLMTPLSSVGDFLHGTRPFNFGSDYQDLVLSLPPGFLADLLSYERPLSSAAGPALDMTYGGGGTHFLVLPFRTYGPITVFFFTALFFVFLVYILKVLRSRPNIYSMSTMSMLIAVFPHFFWYGEKPFINMIVYLSICSIFYKIFSVRFNHQLSLKGSDSNRIV